MQVCLAVCSTSVALVVIIVRNHRPIRERVTVPLEPTNLRLDILELMSHCLHHLNHLRHLQTMSGVPASRAWRAP